MSRACERWKAALGLESRSKVIECQIEFADLGEVRRLDPNATACASLRRVVGLQHPAATTHFARQSVLWCGFDLSVLEFHVV
jgi:hypothetical protein